MITSSRRVFLGGFSSTMLAAGLGTTLGGRLAWARAFGQDDLGPLAPLDFGELEALAALIQENAPDELQGLLIEKLAAGTKLESLVAACALANARAFGGHHYTAYHCQMALMPAWEMSRQLPAAQRPLPVLKVVYRTAACIQDNGGSAREAMRKLLEPASMTRVEAAQRLRAAFLDCDVKAAEGAFAELARHGAKEAYEELQTNMLQENLDVHRVVLAWRAWEELQLTGQQHAETLLRQSVRFCIDAEKGRLKQNRPTPELRALLPELLEQHGLGSKQPTPRLLSDGDVDTLSYEVFASSPADAARLVAARLAEGVTQADVGEALSLAANALLRHDPGLDNASPGKPIGSVHGASVGVHASDAARAWRNIASVSSPRNAVASLIAGAYHTAGQSGHVGKNPFDVGQEPVATKDAAELLKLTRDAIEAREQARAMTLVQKYCDLGHADRQMFDLLLEHGLAADGALHAEKYYRTVCEDHAAARQAFRARHLVALARVTASEHGFEAPGLADARTRLKV